MDISFIYKIAAIGLITAVINQILQKSGKEEYTIIITVAGVIIVALMLLPFIREFNDELSSLFGI
ncbi:MAG: stage III sporulation protein AC [Clostridia bacterium]|mgnify:FL=1|nr:stage III sporulation protein AC [Oscillospiraceae bacterium]MBQ4103891.1 stage III sporulation protein AC [Clostridia bacterium]MBQ5883360.1 stage III sporulation protein AC [Clostridia bacterium]